MQLRKTWNVIGLTLILGVKAGAVAPPACAEELKMKAVGYTKSLPINDPASLRDLETVVPLLGARDLLVRVRAVSVNPVDTKQRKRKEGTPQSPVILGYDAAG